MLCLVIGIMYLGKDFLVPLIWGFFIFLSSLSFLEKVQSLTKIRWGLLVSIHLLGLFAFITGILVFFVYEIQAIIREVPSINDKITNFRNMLLQVPENFGIHTEEYMNEGALQKGVQSAAQYLLLFVSNVGETFANLILIFLYAFLFLFYRNLIPRFFELRIKDKSKVEEANKMVNQVTVIASDYLSGTMIMTAIMGVMLFLVFLIMGLNYALFFALFVAVLNLIPYLGNLIALVVVVAFALLTKEGWYHAAGVVVAITVVNALQENLLRPLIVGERLHLNALIVFVSVVLGGFIWGLSGMILFIPMMGILKIIFEHNPVTRPHALFFGEPGQVLEEKTVS